MARAAAASQSAPPRARAGALLAGRAGLYVPLARGAGRSVAPDPVPRLAHARHRAHARHGAPHAARGAVGACAFFTRGGEVGVVARKKNGYDTT